MKNVNIMRSWASDPFMIVYSTLQTYHSKVTNTRRSKNWSSHKINLYNYASNEAYHGLNDFLDLVG